MNMQSQFTATIRGYQISGTVFWEDDSNLPFIAALTPDDEHPTRFEMVDIDDITIDGRELTDEEFCSLEGEFMDIILEGTADEFTLHDTVEHYDYDNWFEEMSNEARAQSWDGIGDFDF